MPITRNKKKNATVKKQKIPDWEPLGKENSFFHPGSWKTEKLNLGKMPGNLREAGPGKLNQRFQAPRV